MKLYDQQAIKKSGFERIIGDEPSGLLNMNQSSYEWALKIYQRMMALDWTPQEVNTNGESKRYLNLSEYEQRMYDLAFAQLSFDDAMQADAIQMLGSLISNKVVKAIIHRISYEEVNHSTSYAVLLQDTTDNADRVFDLYKTDKNLSKKNEWISGHYEYYFERNDALMLAFMAQIVEGIVFLGGFVAIFTLGQKMTASAQMVAYISKDEINTHLPFFANTVKTILRENECGHRIPEMAELMKQAVQIEIEWLRYISSNVLGFTPIVIEEYVQSCADDRMIAMGFPKLYNAGKNHLNKLMDSYTKVNDKRSNFFESKSSTYSKQELDMDF